MSFLYYGDRDPKVNANFKGLKAKELFVWNEDAQDYLPVSGGGGGEAPAVELPYYLKTNSVQITGEGTSTLLDKDSIDVNDLTSLKGTSLQADRLVFGDSSGNTSLMKDDVLVAQNLKSITSLVPTSDSKMVIFNAVSRKYDYTEIPVPELPAYLKPSSIQIVSAGTNTQLDSDSVDVNSTGTNKASSLQADRLVFTENGVNLSLFREDVGIVNKLNTALNAAVNLTPANNTYPILWNDTAKEFRKTFWTRYHQGTDTATLTAASLKIMNFTDHCTVNADRVFSYTYATNKLAALGNGEIQVGATANSTTGVLDTTKDYSKLLPTSLQFKDSTGTKTLDKNDIAVTNNLKALTSLVPDSSSKMVTYNPTTKVFTHSDIPASSGTGPKTYTLTIPAYDDSTMQNISFLPRFNGETISTGAEVPVAPATLRRYKLNVGDTLILKTLGAAGDAACLYYNTWYAVTISKDTVNYSSSKFEASIVNAPTGFHSHTIDITSAPMNIPASVPSGSILFRINGIYIAGSGSAKKQNTDKFYGAISFRVLSYEASDSPAPTTI